jgi:DNA mismatch endonuclease (patch repair protein)
MDWAQQTPGSEIAGGCSLESRCKRSASGTLTLVEAAEGSWASSSGTRASMRANRSRDTRPELALRRAVHRLGLRYRVAVRSVPTVRRTADLVFVRAKILGRVLLARHGCPIHHTVAKRNAEFWSEKVARNKARDRNTDRRLREAGWLVIRSWEQEDPQVAAESVRAAVQSRRST